jgi:hypothetical protein
MLKTRNIFIALFSFIILSSCNEDIDITGDAKETAVIYGLLDASQQYQYIKINRAFVSGENSLQVAQIPDSNYFKNIQATITEVNNGNVTRSWELKDTILTNKEPGVFYNPEQKVYYFKTEANAPLLASPNVIYKLSVNINNGEFIVNGETDIVSGINVTSPSANFDYSFAHNNFTQSGYSSTNINFNPGTAKAIEVSLNINIEEHTPSTMTPKSINWRIASFQAGDLSGISKSVTAQGRTFYETIKEGVTKNTAINRRVLRSIELTVVGGHEDLQKYMALAKPSSSLSQTKPSFTNLTATNDRNVLGLFSSRNTFSRTISNQDILNGNPKQVITASSRRQLSIGEYTGNLFFCSDHPFDNSEPYFCN